MAPQNLAPRIGVLASGRHYAYVNGYQAEPTIGDLAEVEVALGLKHPSRQAVAEKMGTKVYDVRLFFRHPAWDEADGILYPGITACSKSEANRLARRTADRDGHLLGRGLYYFKATEV